MCWAPRSSFLDTSKNRRLPLLAVYSGLGSEMDNTYMYLYIKTHESNPSSEKFNHKTELQQIHSTIMHKHVILL